MERQKTQNSQHYTGKTILEGGVYSNLKIYYKATAIHNSVISKEQTNRLMEQK